MAVTVIGLADPLRSVNTALNRSPVRTSGGTPEIDAEILRGAHARLAGAEQLRAVGRDRDQLERGQRVAERHRDLGMTVAHRASTLPFHSSTGWKFSRLSPERSPPPPPPPASTALRP